MLFDQTETSKPSFSNHSDSSALWGHSCLRKRGIAALLSSSKLSWKCTRRHAYWQRVGLYGLYTGKGGFQHLQGAWNKGREVLDGKELSNEQRLWIPRLCNFRHFSPPYSAIQFDLSIVQLSCPPQSQRYVLHTESGWIWGFSICPCLKHFACHQMARMSTTLGTGNAKLEYVGSHHVPR